MRTCETRTTLKSRAPFWSFQKLPTDQASSRRNRRLRTLWKFRIIQKRFVRFSLIFWLSTNDFQSLAFSPAAPSFQSCETIRKLNGEAVVCDKNDERLSASQNSDGNLEQFFDFVDKWRANRLAGNKKIDDIFRNSSCKFVVLNEILWELNGSFRILRHVVRSSFFGE